MRYSPKLLGYFHSLGHTGIMQGDDVLSAEFGNEKQGDLISLYLKMNGNKIAEARFQAYGSVVLLAGAEYACSWLEGKSKADALALKPDDILAALELPSFKLHTANLICRALQKVLI